MDIANCSNCWELPLGQSAAKSEREGSTTRSKDRTSKWMEMGRIPMGLRYSLDCIVICRSSLENWTRLTTSFERIIFVAPLHYGFVFFGWLALAIAGVLLQVFSSFSNLIGNDVIEAVDSGLISK